MPRYRTESKPETLYEFLDSYTVNILRKLAGIVATAKLPTRKAELIGTIQARMEGRRNLEQLWGQMDELQKVAVAETVYSSTSTFDADGFYAKYGKDPGWGGISQYGEMRTPSLLCLFIHNGEIPLDLKQELKGFVSRPRAPELRVEAERPETAAVSWFRWNSEARERKKITEAVPLIHRETERAAQRDLLAVMRLVDTGKVRVSAKTQRATSAGAKAIAEVLEGGDFYPPEEKDPDGYRTDPGPIKAFAWPLILQNAGLANISGTKLQLTAAGRKALAAPPQQTIKRAWDRWLRATLLDEFNRINAIKGQTGKGKRGMTAVAGRRQAIVETLRVCAPNKWFAFDEFSRFMLASGIRFSVTRDTWRLYISDSNYGILQGEYWEVFQARYMMAFLFEYAATLGLIDVAYLHPSGARSDYRSHWGADELDCLSRYDGLMYLRINGLGAWCLGLAREYAPSPIEAKQILKALPNMDVVATEPLPAGDRLALEQFAERTSDTVWKIDQEKLLKAVESGQSVADMQAFLTAKNEGDLPETVAVFFSDMAERGSKLADCGTARLIEAADPALAKLITHDSRLRSLCLLAGEKHIVVPAENETAFRRALRQAGYVLPAV